MKSWIARWPTRFKRLPGVGTVNLFGGLTREVQVRLDPGRLAGYGLHLDAVAAARAAENVTLPAGNLKVGRLDYTLRVPGESIRPDEIERVVLRTQNGVRVYLRDVARVVDGFVEERRVAETNNRRGLMMMVQKRSGANTVETARLVREEIGRLKPRLPRDIEFHLISDTSLDIVRAIRNVSNTVRDALVFVVRVTLLFLCNIRTSLILVLTIPFSLIAAFIFLWVSWAGPLTSFPCPV